MSVAYPDLVKSMIAKVSQDTLLQQRILIDVEDFGGVVSKFKSFYLKETDPRQRVPYPYRDENQDTYNQLETKISGAMEMIEFVVSDMKKRMFELERNQSGNDNFNLQQSESQPQYVMANQNEGNMLQRGFQRLTGVKKKKIVNKNDPYQSSILFFKRAYKLMEKWDDHKDWHEEGTDFAEDELNSDGYRTFLKNHRAMFAKAIEPDLMRIYQQGLTLRRAIEKNIMGQVLTKSLAEVRTDEKQQLK